MVSVEERMKVLNLLQTGAITPEQAAQLLQAMDSGRAAPAAPKAAEPPAAPAGIDAWEDAQAPADFGEPKPPASNIPPAVDEPPSAPVSAAPLPGVPSQPGVRARWLHVRVSDMNTGRPRVNVRLPLTLVGFGLKMGRHFAPEMEGMDIEELARVLQTGEPGPFVDVYDEEDGEHVEVFLE